MAVCVAMRRVSGTHIALLRLSAGQSGMMGNKHNPVSRVFGPITPVTNFSQSRGAVKPATLADSFVYLLFVCTGFSSGSSIALTAASPRSIFSGARRRATEAASAERDDEPRRERGDNEGTLRSSGFTFSVYDPTSIIRSFETTRVRSNPSPIPPESIPPLHIRLPLALPLPYTRIVKGALPSVPPRAKLARAMRNASSMITSGAHPAEQVPPQRLASDPPGAMTSEEEEPCTLSSLPVELLTRMASNFLMLGVEPGYWTESLLWIQDLASFAVASKVCLVAANKAAGRTAAHFAAARGHEGCLRVLHELGGDLAASLAAAETDGWTPAHAAAAGDGR